MITLHYFPGNASLTPHMVLRELGLPFELARVDRAAQAHKSPAYLKLNPNGLIPVLVDGQTVLYETAAIVLHLAETHPQAGLAPAVGDPQRPDFLKWLVWLSASLQAQMPLFFYSERYVAAGNADGAAQVKSQAEARIAALIDQLESHLADGRTWMLGQRYSVLDPYVLMLGRWTRAMAGPARERAHLGALMQRVLARPAVQATLAAEGLGPPWV